MQRDEKLYIFSKTIAIYIYIYMITKTAGTFILQKTSVDKGMGLQGENHWLFPGPPPTLPGFTEYTITLNRLSLIV